MSGPRFLDPDAGSRVRATTLARYREDALLLSTWAVRHDMYPVGADQWDDLLVEFKFANRENLTRARFTSVVASVEFFFPRFRGKMNTAHAIIAGWTATAQIKHTVPLGKLPSKLVGMHLSSMGHARLGLGVILQAHTGLRPSEMLGVCPEHVLLPEEQGVSLRQMPLSIALAPRFGTKSKRPQVATLGAAHSDIVRAVAACKLQTPPGSPLFPYTLHSYRALLRRVEQALGLEVGWGPHSPRAGFATDSRAEGWSFVEIREAGRWVADSSLRQYLDIVSAAQITAAIRNSGLAPALAWARAHWAEYFDNQTLAAGYAA